MQWRSAVALALAAGVVGPQAGVAQDTRPGIGVLWFENGGSYGLEKEDYDAFQVGLQQMLITELSINTEVRLVDRSRLQSLLEEQDLGASGRVDATTAARVGKLVGARYVILGGFIDWYADLRLDARIVDVETSEIIKAQRTRGKREDMYDMVVELADAITRGVNLPPLASQMLDDRKDRNVPEEAVRLYMRGLYYADRGQTDRAVELFGRARDVFPAYTEAEEALRQIGRG
jgi:TolB-like protein